MKKQGLHPSYQRDLPPVLEKICASSANHRTGFLLLRHKPLRPSLPSRAGFLFHSQKYFSQKPCFSKSFFKAGLL
jgi:hypothetical protein